MMDNLASHKTQGVQQFIEVAGARVRYLPPYSPDFNLIESMGLKVKQSLRSATARTRRRLVRAIGDGLRSITPADCAGIFRGYGYTATQKPRML